MGRANIIMAVGFMHGLHLSVIHSLSILCKCILFHVSVRSHFSSALNKIEWSFLSVEVDRFYPGKVPVGLLYFAWFVNFTLLLHPFLKIYPKGKKDSCNVLNVYETIGKTCQCYSSDIKQYTYERFAVVRTVFCFQRILSNVFSSHSPLSPNSA